MSSNVEQVKARLSVVDVVGSYVKLTRAGGNWKACCPFHHEKTPSFYVSPGRESWHCFGCDRGGDIFSFVEEYEGVDFLGALKELAGRAGVTLTFDGKSDKGEREAMKYALELACLFYEELLKRKGEVRDYLHDRGLIDTSITTYRLGYAPMGWRHMTEALMKRGVQGDVLEKAGLSLRNQKNPSELYDRFRGRIMFPLIDPTGTVVGFTGRLAPGNTKDQEMGKYVNSPETLLFTKSRFLYGFREAKRAIREKNTAVLVEGQLDLLLSHQVGVLNAVAVSGTALTAEHLQFIGRLADTVIVAFDADLAGMKAAARAFSLALAQGLTVRAVLLPHGMDPADFAKAEPERWKEAIEKAEHLVTFLLRSVRERKLGKEEERKVIEEEVLPFVAALKSPIEQAQFVREIAEELEVPEEAVVTAVRAVPHVQELRKQAPILQGASKTSRSVDIQKRLAALLRWQENAATPIVDVAAFKARLLALVPELPPIEESDVLAVEVAYADTSDRVQKVLEDMLLYLEEELVSKEMSQLLHTLKIGEQGSSPPVPDVGKKYGELAQKKLAIQEARRLI